MNKHKNEELYSFPLVPKVIKLISNTNYIFGFPLGMNLYQINICFKPKLTVKFYISNKVSSSNNMISLFGPFYTDQEGKSIFMRRGLIEAHNIRGIPKLEAAIHVSKNLLTFIVNKLYAELIRFQIGDWLPPGIHLFNIIQSMLLQMGMSVAHSACIASEEGFGIMLLAKPNTGKTYTVFNLVFENDSYYFVSEDMAVIDNNGFAYSCPYTSTYFNNEAITSKIIERGLISRKDRVKLLLAKILPPIPLLTCFGPRQPSTSLLFKQILFKPYVKVKKIVFLEYEPSSEGKIETINKETAIKKLLSLNRAELRYYRDPLIVALSNLNEGFDVEKLLSTESKVLSLLISNTEQYVVKANSPYKFSKFIKLIGI